MRECKVPRVPPRALLLRAARRRRSPRRSPGGCPEQRDADHPPDGQRQESSDQHGREWMNVNLAVVSNGQAILSNQASRDCPLLPGGQHRCFWRKKFWPRRALPRRRSAAMRSGTICANSSMAAYDWMAKATDDARSIAHRRWPRIEFMSALHQALSAEEFRVEGRDARWHGRAPARHLNSTCSMSIS